MRQKKKKIILEFLKIFIKFDFFFKNVQMIDFYPAKTIIVCECALFDLETFLGHQDNIQRHKEKVN